MLTSVIRIILTIDTLIFTLMMTVGHIPMKPFSQIVVEILDDFEISLLSSSSGNLTAFTKKQCHLFCYFYLSVLTSRSSVSIFNGNNDMNKRGMCHVHGFPFPSSAQSST
jgi:hypothetical protein